MISANQTSGVSGRDKTASLPQIRPRSFTTHRWPFITGPQFLGWSSDDLHSEATNRGLENLKDQAIGSKRYTAYTVDDGRCPKNECEIVPNIHSNILRILQDLTNQNIPIFLGDLGDSIPIAITRTAVRWSCASQTRWSRSSAWWIAPGVQWPFARRAAFVVEPSRSWNQGPRFVDPSGTDLWTNDPFLEWGYCPLVESCGFGRGRPMADPWRVRQLPQCRETIDLYMIYRIQGMWSGVGIVHMIWTYMGHWCFINYITLCTYTCCDTVWYCL